MAKTPVPVQTLALIGAATILGVVHSLIVPSNLTLDTSGGFTVPGQGIGTVGVRKEAVGDEVLGGEVQDVPGTSDAPDVDPAAGASPEPEREQSAAEHEEDKISLEQALELHGLAMSGEPVFFLDARLESDYKAGHIDQALSMPFSRLGTDEGMSFIMMLATPGDGTLFVIYCTGGDCEASEDTAIRLKDLGYDNFAIMADGFETWKAAGYPVSAGEGGP